MDVEFHTDNELSRMVSYGIVSWAQKWHYEEPEGFLNLNNSFIGMWQNEYVLNLWIQPPWSSKLIITLYHWVILKGSSFNIVKVGIESEWYGLFGYDLLQICMEQRSDKRILVHLLYAGYRAAQHVQPKNLNSF